MQALTLQPSDEWDAGTGFRKRTVPDPIIDPAHPADAASVIVRLRYTGVCGTDRGIWYRQSFGDLIKKSLTDEQKPIRVLGHELFGEIVELDTDAKAVGLTVGQTVTAESHIVCGICYQCRRKQFHVCTNEKILGISVDGCFAEYIKLPAKVLWPVDTNRIRPELACLYEPFGNAVHAASKVNLERQRIVVLGCGPIGLFLILIAKALGASTIIAVDPHPGNLELAKRFGANVIQKAEKEDAAGFDSETVERVRAETENVGADAVFEMAGYPLSINTALRSARRGGDVVLFGLKSGTIPVLEFDRVITRAGLTLHGVIGRELFQTWEKTQSLLEDRSNGIQDRLWHDLLNEGKGTILPFESWSPETFTTAIQSHPKILLRYQP